MKGVIHFVYPNALTGERQTTYIKQVKCGTSDRNIVSGKQGKTHDLERVTCEQCLHTLDRNIVREEMGKDGRKPFHPMETFVRNFT